MIYLYMCERESVMTTDTYADDDGDYDDDSIMSLSSSSPYVSHQQSQSITHTPSTAPISKSYFIIQLTCGILGSNSCHERFTVLIGENSWKIKASHK